MWQKDSKQSNMKSVLFIKLYVQTYGICYKKCIPGTHLTKMLTKWLSLDGRILSVLFTALFLTT